MNDMHCPMCNSNEIYVNPEAVFRAGPQFVDLDDSANLTPWVCANCGFTAMFVASREELEQVLKEKGWKRLSE